MDYDESYAIIAQAQRTLAENLRALHATQLATMRLHAYALAMLVISVVVSVVGLAGMLWFLAAHQVDTAAVHQTLLTNTQTIAAQTRALLEHPRP